MVGFRPLMFAAVAAFALTGLTFAEPSTKAKETMDALRKAVDAKAGLSDAAKAFVKEKLLPITVNDTIVAETKAQNDKKVALDEIKKIEAAWTKAEEELPIQKEKMSNTCAQAVKAAVKDLAVLAEVFVKDNQGASVGQNALTSSYWHGAKPKFLEAYNGGKGGVYAGKIELDKSTNEQLQQVSLPVIDADGSAIGAIVFGMKQGKL